MKTVIGLSLLLCLASSAAATDWIGVYADPAGQDDHLYVLPGQPETAYIVAHVPSFVDGFVGAEFMVENWPVPLAGEGEISIEWVTDRVLGDIADGVLLSVEEGDPGYPWLPDENGNFVLGVATMTSYTEGWPGENILMEVTGNDSVWHPFPYPLLLTEGGTIYFVDGDFCYLNYFEVATKACSFSNVKALY